jgi:hypothetical protein
VVNRNGRRWNTLLARVASDYPNVEVMHYSAWAANAPARFWYRDELHLSPVGEWEMGRMVRQAADGCDPARSSGPFWDVRDDAGTAGAVAWMHESGLVDGFTNGTYRALIGTLRLPTSRGQLASILWRQAGSPVVPHVATWTDVPVALAPALAWTQHRGILAGAGGNRFQPNGAVTRGQFVRAMWLLAGRPSGAPVPPWDDVPPRLADAASWARATGVLTGTVDGRLRPSEPLERGKLAQILAPPEVPGPLRPPVDDAGPHVAPEVHVIEAERDPPLTAPR